MLQESILKLSSLEQYSFITSHDTGWLASSSSLDPLGWGWIVQDSFAYLFSVMVVG